MKYLRSHALLIVLTCIALGLHFINLGWGSPYFFHPDERNIAMAVAGLRFPLQLNPHFFAYGSLPLYTIYFLGVIISGFSTAVSFSQAILIGRFVSAILATALIPLTYLVGKKLERKSTGLLAAGLTTFSVGIIQFAHFTTFEMWLTFFTLLLFWFCLALYKTPRSTKLILGTGIVFGILVATKVSSLSLLPLCLIPLFHQRPKKGEWRIFLGDQLTRLFLLLAVAILVYLICNPFAVLDFTSFQNSISYESSVALGTLPVFYTQGFLKTIPGLYQILHVFPFLLNPIATLFGIIFLFGCIVIALKKRLAPLFLLVLFFLFVFTPQAVLFVKWTRYMVPTLPFIYLMIAFCLTQSFFKTHAKWSLTGLLMLSGVIFSFAFVKTVYLSPDPRLAAALWAKTHFPQNTTILSESYDLGIVPFNGSFPSISLFNFYDLDTDPHLASSLSPLLQKSQVIILPSQRLIKPRLNHPDIFPASSRFYQKLTTGSLGFHKIYQTPCPFWCQVLYLGNPINSFEETASVFDHPTVMIFQKHE